MIYMKPLHTSFVSRQTRSASCSDFSSRGAYQCEYTHPHTKPPHPTYTRACACLHIHLPQHAKPWSHELSEAFPPRNSPRGAMGWSFRDLAAVASEWQPTSRADAGGLIGEMRAAVEVGRTLNTLVWPQRLRLDARQLLRNLLQRSGRGGTSRTLPHRSNPPFELTYLCERAIGWCTLWCHTQRHAIGLPD